MEWYFVARAQVHTRRLGMIFKVGSFHFGSDH